MQFNDEQLERIYDRTSGYCHLCHKKLAFTNYGNFGAKGAWEVEHSNPRASGGSDRMCNLFAACMTCNRAKGTSRTAVARRWSGKSRAPLSPEKRQRAKNEQAVAGAVLGGLAGSVLGPVGTLVGAALGASIGNKHNPDRG